MHKHSLLLNDSFNKQETAAAISCDVIFLRNRSQTIKVMSGINHTWLLLSMIMASQFLIFAQRPSMDVHAEVFRRDRSAAAVLALHFKGALNGTSFRPQDQSFFRNELLKFSLIAVNHALLEQLFSR